MARLAVWVCCFTIIHFACSFRVVRMRSAPEMLGPRVARLYNRRGCVPSMSSSEANQVKKLQEQLKGTCIYLIGMTGCGKSTVGAELASQLGYRFLDTDALAEYMIEMPIAQFFQQECEEKFRDVEHQVLSQLAQYTRVVVATGGGIVTQPKNWGLMQQGLIVYLDLPPEHIHKRLVAIPEEVSKRPLLAGTDALGKLTELAEARRDKYLAADVHYMVDPLHTPAQTAEEVQRALLRCIAENPPRWRTWKERQEQRARDMAAVVSQSLHRCSYAYLNSTLAYMYLRRL